MAVKLSPWGNSQFLTETGAPASGWKVYAYAAGSSTPLATYTDNTGGVAQTNPIVLNTLGFPTTGQIWLTSGLAYKLVLTDSSGTVKKTEDNISGVNDASIAQSQWVASGLTPTYVSASSFTVAGDQTSAFQQYRRLQFTTSIGTVYGTIVTSVFTALTTVTVTMDGASVLDAGLSSVNLSLFTSVNSAIPTNIPNAINATTAANGVPVGAVINYSGTSAPTGFLTCPISATNINRTTYAALFAAIGTTWGIGDGSTTFGLPWFAADYAAVQANGNVGQTTVGAVIAHVHTQTSTGALGAGNMTQKVIGAVGSETGDNNQTASTGGAANFAAGVRLLKCVKY